MYFKTSLKAVLLVCAMYSPYSASGTQLSSKTMTDGVCFYEHTEYRGDEFCYQPGASLSSVPRNDKWGSVRIIGDAQVTYYEHSRYKGDSRVAMASAYKLHNMNDEISSIKVRVRGTEDFACMYDHDGFRGDVHCLAAGQGESRLKNRGYNDATSSMLVSGNVKVDVYKDSQYQGKHGVITTSTSDFDARGGSWLDDEISSWRVDLAPRKTEQTAIKLQALLGYPAALEKTTILTSHNSYNSSAYVNYPAVLGPNQRRNITEQLALGARSFELDPSDKGSGDDLWLCHATDCNVSYTRVSTRRLLAEMADWLHNNSDEVIYIYFDVGIATGRHQLAREIIEESFGRLLYRPQGREDMSAQLTSADVLAQGKQVVIYDQKNAITDVVYKKASFEKGMSAGDTISSIPGFYYANGKYNRIYECNHNFCSDTLNQDEVQSALLAGVNAVSQDQLHDNNTYSLWAFDYTENSLSRDFDTVNTSAVLTNDGRYYMKLASNTIVLPILCFDNVDGWFVGNDATFSNAQSACNNLGAHFIVPTNKYEASLARDVLRGSGVSMARINFSNETGAWLSVK